MKVLSIDIDFLFDCQDYHKLTNFDLTGEQSWEMINALGNKYEPHKKYLELLKSILKKNTDKNTKIEIITEHDEIIKTMENNNITESDLFNFDFHHDVTYFEGDSKLTLENWVRYAKSKNLVSRYNWIHRELSEYDFKPPFNFDRICVCDLNLNVLPKFDLVVICISKHFTPMEYWESLPKELYNIVKGVN